MPSTSTSHISGPALRDLMAAHAVTPRELAARHRITQKRVREVLRAGVRGFLAVEWYFLVVGVWVEEIHLPDARSVGAPPLF